jgi:hypothetical protein
LFTIHSHLKYVNDYTLIPPFGKGGSGGIFDSIFGDTTLEAISKPPESDHNASEIEESDKNY